MSRLHSEQTAMSKVLPEEGLTVARVYQLIELGEHTKLDKENKELTKYRYWIQFELPNLTHDFGKGEQPFSISMEVPFTLMKPDKIGGIMRSPFSELLFALGGREKYSRLYSAYIAEVTSESEITTLINQYVVDNQVCMIDVSYNENKSNPEIVYANVGDTKQLMKGMTCPNRVNPMFNFDFFSNYKNLDSMPTFLQDKVKKSNTFQNGNYKIVTKTLPAPKSDELPVINSDDLKVEMPF
jgi:hypothetical protein